MPTSSRTYDEIINEWLQKRRNGVDAGPMPGDPIQQATDYLQRGLSGRAGTITNMAGARTGYRASDMPVSTPPTGLEIAPSDVTAQIGADLGALGDLVAPNTTIHDTQSARTGYVGARPGSPSVETTPSDALEQTGRSIGGAIPSMATTAPLLATSVGLPLAMMKSYGEAYTPQADPVAGFISGAGMALAPGAVSGGSRLAEAAAERFLLPAVSQIAREGAPAAVAGLKTAVDPTTHAVMAGSRLAGGVAGGTAVAEGQRQATSLANTGELSAPSGTDLMTDLGLNLAFAASIVKGALSPRGKPMSMDAQGNPVFSEQAASLVAEVMNRSQQAQTIRNAQAEKTTAYNNARGQRISDAHQEIFQAAQDGTDPSVAIGKLKAHWDEAAQVTDPVHGLAVLKSMSDEGNTTGIPDDAFHKIVAAVQGKYADHFKNDPSLPGPERVNQMIKAGVMPAITKEWISTNFADAVDMMLGDYEGAKSNMANRIFAFQMERLPSAMEAMKGIDARAGTDFETKTSMGQITDSAKDAQYMQTFIDMYPHLKNAVVPKGGTNDAGEAVDLPLIQALYKRDQDLSIPMFDASGPFQTGKKAKYDAWRDAMIQVAGSYNPTTRQGMYQKTANGPLVPISFEDMVAQKDGKYTFKPRVIREMDRPGASEAVRDAIEFVDNIQQRRSPDDELSLENQQDLISGKPQHLPADKGLQRTVVPEATDQELTADAHDLGVDPKHLDKYIGDMRDFEQPGLGLNEQSPATLYDVGLHLMSKVSKGDSKDMYKKYGEKYFGSMDPETKKPELFKAWLLARLESEIGQQGTTKSVIGAERQDVHQISKAQADFYQQWREVANKKRLRDGKEPIPLPTTWGEKREQYRHALRLYAGTRGNVDMKQLFIDLLDDNKTYQNFLRRAKGEKVDKASLPDDKKEYDRPQKEMSTLGFEKVSSPEFQALWKQSEEIKNRNGGMPPGTKAADGKSTTMPSTEQDITHSYSGFTTPVFDALRVGESFGKRIGLDEGSAKELGALTSKFVQAFPEFAGFGETKTNEAGVMGLHVRNSEDLQGPVALVNLDTIDQRQRGPLQKLASYLMTVGHELSHIASIPSGMTGAYRQQRVDNKDLVKGMFTEIGFDGTVDLLNAIQEVVLPPQFRPKTLPSIVDQGSGFEEEAFSRLMEYTMLGAMTKDSPWAGKTGKKTDSWGEAVKFLPDEVQASMHLAFRDLTNVAGAVAQYFKNRPQQPKDKFIANTFQTMADYANKFVNVNSVKLAQFRAVIDRQRAMLAAAGSVNLEDPVMVRTVLDVDEDAMNEVTGGVAMAMADDTKEAIGEAQTAMFGNHTPNKLTLSHERALGTRVPAWSHWMALSYQTMLRFHKEGNPLAETVMYKVNDLEKAYFRLNRTMHDPFMIVDDKGRLKYDPEHPLLRILQRSDPAAVRARVVLSDLARWANEVGKPVIVDGKLSNEVPAGLLQKLTSFKPEDQQGILKGMESLLKGTQEAATVLFNDRVESSAARLGAIMMTVDRTMFSDKVFAIGKQIVETSVVLNNAQAALKQAMKEPTLAAEIPAAQQRAMQAQQAFNQSMAGLQGEQMAAVQTYLFGKDGIATELSALDEFFKKRAEWFTTESRPGRYFIQSHLPEGGAHYTSAPNLREANAVQKRLAAAGHTGILATDRQHPTSDNMIDAPDAIVQSYMNKEAKAWQSVRDAMAVHLSPDDLKWIDDLGYAPGAEVQKGMESKGIKRYMQERKGTPGREDIDMIDAFRDYTGRLSGSVARRGLTRELSLLLNDPRLRNEGEFKQVVKTMQDTLLQPLNNGLQTVRAGLTARYLGLPNLVGPMIEMLQSGQGVLPYFIQNVGFVKGTKTFTDALVAPARIKSARGSLEYRRTLASAKDKELIDPRAMTKEESTLFYYDRQQTEGGFKQGPIYASGFSRNHQMLEQAAFGLGASKPKPVEQMVSDPLYWMAQMSMVVYSTASDYNTRVSFLGALDMLYDRGLRGQELYQGASAYQNLYTHGGGKANTVGYVNKVSNLLTRSAWGLTETMQRYMFGNATMQKEMFDEMIGRVEEATPRQRKNAGQAFATAQFVQFLLAGAMGLTGVGIAATVIQKATGYDPKQKLREFWRDMSERLGADEPQAVLLANYAQNGFVSNTLGVDVSNRVTMNSFLGFNEYDGFNTNELSGVVSSSIEDLWNATKYVAQGDMTKAGRSMASPSMRPYIDLYASKRDYGDLALRDNSNNMITQQTGVEAVKSAIGLKPYRYRLLKDAKLAQMNSDNSFKQTQEQKFDELSRQLLQGNTAGILEHVQKLRAQDPTIMPQATVSSILDRAVNATRPSDPLASGPSGNAPAQRQIASSFGNVEPRQSELQDLITRERLNATTGFMGGPPTTAKAVDRAVVVDALVKSRGLTRSEASRMATLLGY